MNEHDVEKAITKWLAVALPAEAVSFHVPNGAQLGARQVWQMKAAGMTAGVPDRVVVWRGRAFFLEAKGPRGLLSDAQVAMHARLRTAECKVGVVRSIEDAERFLGDECGIPLRARSLPMNMPVQRRKA